MDNSEQKKKFLAFLKEQYQVGQYKNSVSDSFLYMILRKANLDIPITDLDREWLKENGFNKTIEIISLQQYKKEEEKNLENDFFELRNRYYIPKELEITIDSPIYSILGKLDAGYSLSDSELEILNRHNLVDTVTLIHDIINFSKLKIEYKATRHKNQFPEEPLYSILKKLDAKEELSRTETEVLLNDFEETLEIYWQQEDERKSQRQFAELKLKYKVDYYPDHSISSPLYSILKKIDSEKELESSESEWLKQEKLVNLIKIDEDRKDRKLFGKLKEKYKATQYENSEPSSPLFVILENLAINDLKKQNIYSRDLQKLWENEKLQINEKDIKWLLEQGLIETSEIARQIHFKILTTKYQIVQPAFEPFYEIMLKLEREERLDPKQVIQLIEKGSLYRHGKIAIAHYRLEAIFYEKEYERTKNKWNLPSASSNWRKADKPEQALKVTDKINWKNVKESDLKSALLVTRGAAFRDLDQLDEAENCAMQAKECQPGNHQPYTLLGAICYDRHEYTDGDRYFEMAEERGANDIDDEIEKIVRMTKDKDKRREVAEYLFKKNPDRYWWAHRYLN